MFWSWLFVIVLVPAVAWSVRLALRVPAVWRGDQEAFGSVLDSLLPSRISRRTYLPFALTVKLFVGGLLVVGTELGAGWMASTWVWCCPSSPSRCGRASSTSTGRTCWCRRPSGAKPGSSAQDVARRKRRATGKPPSVHAVDVLDVHPPPEKPDDYPLYFVAICSDDECDWMSDPVGYEDDSDPEANVRRQLPSIVTASPSRPGG